MPLRYPWTLVLERIRRMFFYALLSLILVLVLKKPFMAGDNVLHKLYFYLFLISPIVYIPLNILGVVDTRMRGRKTGHMGSDSNILFVLLNDLRSLLGIVVHPLNLISRIKGYRNNCWDRKIVGGLLKKAIDEFIWGVLMCILFFCGLFFEFL